jgi:hypothetical protein
MHITQPICLEKNYFVTKNIMLVYLQLSFIAMNYYTISSALRIEERGLTKVMTEIATRLSITLASACH